MNDPVKQLTLFSLDPDRSHHTVRQSQYLDADSEEVLAAFISYRLAQGAAPATARAEAGQLRSLCHAVKASSDPVPVRHLLQETDALVSLIAGSGPEVSTSTNRLRLRALGSFAMFASERFGISLDQELEAVYRRLPHRRPPSWNHTGVVVGGTRGRRRQTGKTMLAGDLAAVVARGPGGSGYQAVRDRVLLTCACYTGLQLSELAGLHWEQIECHGPVVRIQVRRADHEMVLRGADSVSMALIALGIRGRQRFGPTYGLDRTGPVFRCDQAVGGAISERQALRVLKQALTKAGFPEASQYEVTRAFVHWLLLQGLSGHEAMAVAGIRDARTFDRLMERVRRLMAQRVVHEHQEIDGPAGGDEAEPGPGASDPGGWPPG